MRSFAEDGACAFGQMHATKNLQAFQSFYTKSDNCNIVHHPKTTEIDPSFRLVEELTKKNIQKQ
jgi:hypothetical protein